MLTVDEFKLLIKYQNLSGCHVLCDGQDVFLMYDDEEDEDYNEEDRCNFSFSDDIHNIVCYMRDYQESKWTVQKVEEINWRLS